MQNDQENALSFELSCRAILPSKFANMPLKCCIDFFKNLEIDRGGNILRSYWFSKQYPHAKDSFHKEFMNW